MNSLIKRIQSKLKYGFTVEWYNFWWIVLLRKHKFIPKIASIDETLDYVIANRCSVSRFGDGEVLLTNPNKEIGFQVGDPKLAERLKEVLNSQSEGHIVCLSDTFRDLNRYTHSATRFWRTHFFLYENLWIDNLHPERQYYNTFITRPYMDFADKSKSMGWFKKMKGIWNDRDIIFIEGEKSRLGVGNDLFDNARSIRRILCPPRDAFGHYDDILAETCKHEKDALYLIALGPTATVLAYDIHKTGRQAVDIGHVDVEYEWCRIGTKKKVALTFKAVNESRKGDQVANPDETYTKQIIARI
jgi:glycosyltransferase family protein